MGYVNFCGIQNIRLSSNISLICIYWFIIKSLVSARKINILKVINFGGSPISSPVNKRAQIIQILLDTTQLEAYRWPLSTCIVPAVVMRAVLNVCGEFGLNLVYLTVYRGQFDRGWSLTRELWWYDKDVAYVDSF